MRSFRLWPFEIFIVDEVDEDTGEGWIFGDEMFDLGDELGCGGTEVRVLVPAAVDESSEGRVHMRW
jgi:hypothetical protein